MTWTKKLSSIISCRDKPASADLPREPEDRWEAPVSGSRFSWIRSHQVQRLNWCVCVCVCVLHNVKWGSTSLSLHVWHQLLFRNIPLNQLWLLSFFLFKISTRGRISLHVPEPPSESVDSPQTNETCLSRQGPRPRQLGLEGSRCCQFCEEPGTSNQRQTKITTQHVTCQ